MNSKKIVITGASGFLGRHLLERLKDDSGYSVYALSSRPEELRAKTGGTNISFLYKDLLFGGDAESILPGAVVISCAYPRNTTGAAVAEGLKYIQRVFEAAVERGASAIINISSQSVYSAQRTEPATEETPVCLETPYAVGKYAVELMLESICRNSQTAFSSIRMASLIGPDFDQRIVNRLIRQGLETGSLRVKDNRQRFGFFDVEDAVSGLTAMIDTVPAMWKPVYNLGGNGAYSLLEIAEAIQETMKEMVGESIKLDVAAGEEEGSSIICADEFVNDFSFSQWSSLKDSVRKICNAEILRLVR